MMSAPKFQPYKFDAIMLDGGLDEVTPPLRIKPGYCRRAQNHEIDINGGYKVVSGYERFDGRTRPSDATYSMLPVTITGSYAVGNTINGVSSGATAVIAEATSTHFIITRIVGVFAAGGETINIGGSPVATSSGGTIASGASTAKLDAQYKNAAADIYRSSITSVDATGTGSVRGIFRLNDVMYAIRDNSGGTAAGLWKSTTSGWVSVPLGNKVNFTLGKAELVQGGTLTQGGVTAPINRVVLTSGAWTNATLVTSGAFDSDVNWTKGANWSIASGVATASAATSDLSQNISVFAGYTYEVTFTIKSFTGGTVTPYVGGAAGTARASDATFTETIVASNTTSPTLKFTASGFTGSIDNVSVRLINAAGTLILGTVTGGSFAAGVATDGSSGSATLSGAQSAITLTVGGTYETVKHTFGTSERIYGCSGVQRGFEFDGTVYVPINTGLSDALDKPTHVIVHKEHLFFSVGSSVMHSAIDDPYNWTALLGAAEIPVGDTVSGFALQPGAEVAGGALAIYSRNRTNILYGSSAADWNLANYSDEQGAYARTMARIGGMTLSFDDKGISILESSANYGNFQSVSLSRLMQKTVNSKRSAVSMSCISTDKNQYRLFFTDKTAIYATLDGNKLRGLMPMLFGHYPTCIWSGEDNDGNEVIFFGSTNGMVYQMDRGTSFDGDPIESYIHIAFTPSKSVRQKKRYKNATIEISGDGYYEFSFGYELGYASSEIEQPSDQSFAVSFEAVNWDSFTWDSFAWDGVQLSPTTVSMTGSAENLSIILRSSSDYFSPALFSSIILQYIPRRGLR